jgi:Ca2+-binding EF-hand superfamily protein
LDTLVTMSSRYQKQFTIPEGFPQLLKTFSREVLRCQPPNIYKFGARYFAQLVEARQAETEEAMGGHDKNVFDMSAEELQDFITELFLEFDADQNGHLDRREFKNVMHTAKLGLSKKEIRRLMAEADEDGNGMIEYREFVPVMVEIVHSLKAKADASELREAQEEDARAEVEEHLLHGIPREQLEEVMKGVFEMADEDGSGYLDRDEFRQALKSADLGLTRKDINLLLSEADLDGDGKISYNEFIPICFNILVERFKDQVLHSEALQSTDELMQTLLATFQDADEAGAGKLPLSIVKQALRYISDELLGLTRLQMLSILSEANPDAENNVDYTPFAASASTMIYSLVDMASQEMRVKAVNQLAATEGADLLHGLDHETVKSILLATFQEADADQSGTLDAVELLDLVKALGTSDLQLTSPEINSLLASIDTDGDGAVDYVELVDFMIDVLTHVQRERYVSQVVFDEEA